MASIYDELQVGATDGVDMDSALSSAAVKSLVVGAGLRAI